MNGGFKVWFRGLLAAVIHGAAAAGVAFIGLATAKGLGSDVPQLQWRQLGIVLMASGISSLLAFLRQSPIPITDPEAKK